MAEATIVITVIAVSQTQAVDKNSKSYFKLEVAYKDADGTIKGKTVMPFGDSKPVFNVLKNAVGGEIYNISMVKPDKYWNWIAANKSDGSTPVVTSAPAAVQSGGKVIGSNYPTSDERADIQRYIIRQSSLGHATKFHEDNIVATEETVINTAKIFENYVLNKPAPTATTLTDDFESDVPL